MSYFLFGKFDLIKNSEMIQKVKSYGNKKGVYFLFDEEITIYEEIHRMCKEQGVQGNTTFALTSLNQPYNSSDLLFPFDKYSHNELFPDNSKENFITCCRRNIERLFDCLKALSEICCLVQLNILVVEGYDDNFATKTCILKEMEDDLLLQIENNGYIDSCIYCVIR